MFHVSFQSADIKIILNYPFWKKQFEKILTI